MVKVASFRPDDYYASFSNGSGRVGDYSFKVLFVHADLPVNRCVAIYFFFF